jgi:F-box protein 21
MTRWTIHWQDGSPPYFHTTGLSGAIDRTHHRYHATAVICYIHRRRALAIWTRVREYNDVPLEIGLLALELFLPSAAFLDIKDIVHDLDNFAAQFLSVTPDFEAFSTEERATALITWMWAQGFKGTCAGHYCALKNVFVGMTIRTIRTATPLTLVAIFCALARRVGLKAHPCGYPSHVLAIVEEPNTGEYQYYDIFPGTGADPRKDRARLIDNFIGDTQTLSTILSPARTSLMIARAAQNIFNALQLPATERIAQNYGYPDICERATLYAALTAMAVLKPGPGPVTSEVVRQLTEQIPLNYPMDVRLLEEELPKGDDRVLVENVCGALRAEDSTPRAVYTRYSSENKHVLVSSFIRGSFVGNSGG